MKTEGNSSTGGDNAESLAEDLMKRYTDSKPVIKKEPVSCKYSFKCKKIMAVTLKHGRHPFIYSRSLNVYYVSIFCILNLNFFFNS